MFKRLRERHSRKSQSEQSQTDNVVPVVPQSSRKNSVGSFVSEWSRSRSLTPSDSRVTGLDPRQASPSSRPRRPSPSPGPAPEATAYLGLHVVHQPVLSPLFDIIFVHGLGGDGQRSWSKDPNDPTCFWPQCWLPWEPDLERARILSFGYNANFLHRTPRNVYKVGDFAKELLYEMKFSKDPDGQDLNVGKLPIIFVMHSMGGLVAKKAYLLGQNDEIYKEIIESISAMIFLATPHRGTNLAEVLNRLLTSLFQPSRDFIADLSKNSPALEDINEQFRHVAPKLSIWSFYETIATQVGPMKLMILDKDSSILGYSKEISRPLNADHHGMSKYSSPEDSNYISVRNAVSSLAKSFRASARSAINRPLSSGATDIANFLGRVPDTEEDLNFVRRRWIPGTGDWLLNEPRFRSWLGGKHKSCITWFNAPPASGKSFLAAHVISHLRELGAACQFFFFKFDDPKKRSLNGFLRSLAHQMSRDVASFRDNLREASTKEPPLEQVDPSLIWKKIFVSILFNIELSFPMYWVIDGLDESDSSKALLELLSNITYSKTPIRIMIFSRKTESLVLLLDRVAGTLPVETIEKNDYEFNSADIGLLVEKEIKYMRGNKTLRHKVAQTVGDRARGSFLWARLVLENIINCHSEDAIQEALTDVPSDMNDLYRRMETTILEAPGKANTSLAKALLSWIACASRSLTLQELAVALKPEFSEMLDLRRTVQDVCGQFVLVKENGQVTIVHQTARDYLINSSNGSGLVDIAAGHTQLFFKCISALSSTNIRVRLMQDESTLRRTAPLLFYSATSWMHHLRHMKKASDEILDGLVKVFTTASVLTWIHTLSIIGRLETLVKASKALTSFVSDRRKANLTQNPLLHRLSDIDLLERWGVDLLKITGKFGRHLHSDPPAIYKLLPPLCPQNSVLYQQFHHLDSAVLAIDGISNSVWNDNLVKIALRNGEQAWGLECTSQHLAVLGSTGTMYIWNTANFTEACLLRHQEPVTAFGISTKANQLITCGLRNIKLWTIPSGQMVSRTTTPLDTKVMSVVFAENDSKVIIGLDDRTIRYLNLGELQAGWQILNDNLLRETSQLEGTVIGSPMCMAFNGDATQVGVSYRGFPLSVWALSEGVCISRCKRAKVFRNDHARPSASWFAVDRFTWNPVSGHVIGIYKDGCVFKWHPVTGQNQEAPSVADEIAASSDGRMFITSNSSGAVQIWNFAYFSVIYELKSGDLVTNLAFSPDSRRFYDLRGSSVNAWEPNSLIRLSGSEDSTSDVTSEDHSSILMSHMSEAVVAACEATTVVSAAPNNSTYCMGNEEGIVKLFNPRLQKSKEIFKFSNFFGVSHLAWDKEAKHIVAADLGGDIRIIQLSTSPVNGEAVLEVKVLSKPTIDLGGRGIEQLLPNHDASLLLLICHDRGHVWSRSEGNVDPTVVDLDVNRRYMRHPTQDDEFLGFGMDDIRVFRWHDFSEKNRIPLDLDFIRHGYSGKSDLRQGRQSFEINDLNGAISNVNKVILAKDGRQILLQTKTTFTNGQISKRVAVFDVSIVNHGFPRTLPSLGPPSTHIPMNLQARIEIPLGILPGSLLAYLDQDLWFCTYKMKPLKETEGASAERGAEAEAPKRHYFVPRDWTTSENIDQCCLMGDDVLLCPKDDQVAVFRYDFTDSGF